MVGIVRARAIRSIDEAIERPAETRGEIAQPRQSQLMTPNRAADAGGITHDRRRVTLLHRQNPILQRSIGLRRSLVMSQPRSPGG